ncbi:MAG: hypothetical protein EPN85_11250 [Bacteroidetes bacterium]|nr:MAG: hypothetical protein EPN85_11250 [Bacteroidota bacterium]
MKRLQYTLCIFFAVVMHSLPFGEGWGGVFAQKILKDTMLHVVKSFQPTIADAYKMNDMPVVRDSVPPIPKLTYGINSKKINTPFTVATLKSAKMVGEPLSRLYSTLIRVGGGNYNTPYAEVFYNNLRSKEISYGAHLKHLSSKSDYDGYGFGGFSDNTVKLYGKKFLHKHTLSGDFGYDRNLIHYYGYDTGLIHILDEKALITKQRYSNIHGNLGYQSHYTDSLHLNYLINLKYYHFRDFYKTSENNLCASVDMSGYYEKQLVHAPLSLDYYNNKDTIDTASSVIVSLAPYILSSGAKWNTRIGMGIAVENDQDNKSRFLFYPNIDFNYNVWENIVVPYAGVTGGLKKNSLKSLTEENPFLIPSPDIKNTNTRWEMYAGIKGSISKNVSYNTRTSFSRIQSAYFFVNDDSDFFKKGFNTVYDDVNLWNIHGEIQYQREEKIKVILKGDYNAYDMLKELKPWHKSLWQTTLTANYNLKNKIVATADIFVYGKRNARIFKPDPWVSVSIPKELKPVMDANIGLEYRYSKKLSAFVNFNNLGLKRYTLWNNYPSQKFNFMAGVTMVF